MKKDRFGITLRFYAVLGFVCALLGQPMLCAMLLGFVIVVQQDTWLTKQAMQAFLLSLAPLLLAFISAGFLLVDRVPLFGTLFAWMGNTLVAVVNFVVLLLCIYAIINAVREKDGGIFGLKNFADWAYGNDNDADDAQDALPHKDSHFVEQLKEWTCNVGAAVRGGIDTLSKKWETKKTQWDAEKEIKREKVAAEQAAAEKSAAEQAAAEKSAAEQAAAEKSAAEQAAAEKSAAEQAAAEKAAAEQAAAEKSAAEKSAAAKAAVEKAAAEKAAAEQAAAAKAAASKARTKKQSTEKQPSVHAPAAPQAAADKVAQVKTPVKKTPPKKPAGKK